MNELELKNQILSIINKNDINSLLDFLSSSHSIDISIVLEDFTSEELRSFLNVVPIEQLAEIVEVSDEDLQVQIVKMIGAHESVKLFSYMSVDDVTDIIGMLHISYRKEILKKMKSKDSEEVEFLLKFGEDTAGGIMTTQFIQLDYDLTIKDALNKIKKIAPETEVIETIFIVNEKNILLGKVDLRDIFTHDEEKQLIEITDRNNIVVFPDTDQEEVSLLFSKYSLSVIPVVNKKGALIGIITFDDIIDVIIEESTEDILALAGVSADEKVDNTVKESIKERFPWLVVNLFTAFLASFTVSMFESTINQVVALAACMPIVAGMGGNAGTQTLSVVVRSIALGEIELKKDFYRVFKEILIGVIDGASIGVFAGIVIYFMYGNFYLSVIIFLAMIINLVIAGFFGFIVPLTLKQFNIDPAIASSIFVTTATDVIGFFAFLGLATIFLPYLVWY